jgi:CheY-like chemotaxis protein
MLEIAPSFTDVLIVDDEPFNRKILTYHLQSKKGIRLHTAIHGQDALDVLHCLLSESDEVVVLLDLDMPVMDGYDFLRVWNIEKKRYVDKQVSIVLVTASDPDMVMERGLNPNRYGFIQKPINFVHLNRLLKEHVELSLHV